MPTIITPSGCSSYSQCPYKWANSVYTANPLNTVHGNLANAAAAAAISKGSNKLGAYLRYYESVINPMLPKRKQLSMEVVKKGLGGIYEYLRPYANENYQVWQEQKLEFPYIIKDNEEDSVWLSGTPDIVIINNHPTGSDILAEVIDIKCGSISWYDGPDIWRENAQWYFYPRFILKQRHQEILLISEGKKPKIKFTFLVMDKKSGEVKPFSKVLDENTIEINVKQNVKGYLDLKEKNLDKTNYPATECRACKMCPLADECPLKKATPVEDRMTKDTGNEGLFS